MPFPNLPGHHATQTQRGAISENNKIKNIADLLHLLHRARAVQQLASLLVRVLVRRDERKQRDSFP